MKRKSEETKDRLGMGTGEGAGYKPRIEGREFNANSTTVMLRDWETKRPVELLSQGEAMYWHILRFRDDVVEVREQVKLPLEKTVSLAHELGIKHPRNEKTAMTTDFHIICEDGHEEAVCFKPSRRVFEKARAVESVTLEKEYWTREGADFSIAYKTDINVILAENIRMCSYYYDEDTIFDPYSAIKHLIIRKKVRVPMDKEELDFANLIKKHYGQIAELLNSLGVSADTKRRLKGGKYAE